MQEERGERGSVQVLTSSLFTERKLIHFLFWCFTCVHVNYREAESSVLLIHNMHTFLKRRPDIYALV